MRKKLTCALSKSRHAAETRVGACPRAGSSRRRPPRLRRCAKHARRQVATGEILGNLSEIEYWYTRRGEEQGERIRVQKIVQFYVMKYTHGSIEDHDQEVEEVRWYSLSDALKEISYDAEKRVLQEAIHSWDAYLYRKGIM